MIGHLPNIFTPFKMKLESKSPRALYFLVAISMLISIYFQEGCASSNKKVEENVRFPQKIDIDFNRNYTAVYFDPLDFMEYSGLRQSRLDNAVLVELLKTLHTRFDEIMVPFHVPLRRIENFSNYDVPEATALYNQINNESSSTSSVLKLSILFKVSNWVGQSLLHWEFKLGQKVKNSANSIFPGTVKSVILEILEDQEVHEHYVKFREFFGEFDRKHKFGIQLDAKYCSGIPPTTSQFPLKLRNDILGDLPLDLAYFSDNVTSHIPDRTVENALNRFDSCQKLFGSLHRRVELGLMATWPDTDMNGRMNQAEMIRFWRRMDKWAWESKTPVIFLQAFDTPWASDMVMKTNGWWRLFLNSSYLNPSQFIFAEKILAIKIDGTGSENHSLNRAWLAQDTAFQRDVVGVHFNIFDLWSGVGNVDQSSLVPLIEEISTKFDKILLTMESLDEDLYLSPLDKKMTLSVPGTLARWTFNGTRKPLRLFMTFDRTTATDAAGLTLEANQIAPATVTQLIYSTPSFDEEALFDGFSEIAKVPEVFGRIDLGIKIKVESCKNRMQFLDAMNHLGFYFTGNFKIKVIYISATIPLADTILGAERALPLLLVSFENCRKMVMDYMAISKERNKIEMALITGWPSKGDDQSLDGMIKHVRFWEQVNDWAAKDNTTVIMNSAFDPPSMDGSREKSAIRYGWWTVSEDESLGSNGHLLFVDKKKAAYILATKSTSTEDDSTYLSASIVIPSGTFFVIFMLMTILTVWHLRRSEYLTKEEIAQFLNGGGSKSSSENLIELDGPYQKGKFELSNASFSIEESSPLGSGAFGKVCMGRVTRGDVVQEVAIKMAKVPCPRTALWGLLIEIKILAYLGKHPHIVDLVGAHTAQLRKGKVFIFLELCLLGSLQDYLRKWKQVDVQAGGQLPDESLVSDLPRWSYEIASGLEFIASKHVVHLDIASRNVLLTEAKVAKITDFGLSRRMYSQIYKKEKEKQELLPWRWMAPESLRRSEFTEKSDVWGFGVLLWEIYSLGDEPYPGLAWEVNFPTKLERGLRLCEPMYNSNSMYSVMLSCWNTKPERRPTFSEIVQMLPSGYSALLNYADPPEELSQTCTNKNVSTQEQDASRCRATAAGNFDNPVRVIGSKFALPKEKSNSCFVWSFLAAVLFLMIATISILYIKTNTDTGEASLTMDNSSFGSEINISTNSTSPKSVPGPTSAGGETSIFSLNGSVNPVTEPVTTERGPEVIRPNTVYQFEKKQRALNEKLFMAIDGGNEAAVNALIKLGASVNATVLRQTPVLRASNCGTEKIACLKILKSLVENRADVFVKDGNGGTFLHNLFGGPHSNGPTVTPSQFHDMATFLISKNLTKLFNIPGYHGGHTPLTWAVKTIEIQNQTLVILHQAGANLHAVNYWGNSILADALFGFRSTEFLTNLIALGVDWRHLNKENLTLVHHAAWYGHVDGTKHFLRYGLPVNSRTTKWRGGSTGGDTPLHLVVRFGKRNILETARVLIENGASLNLRNENRGGRTPLEEAIWNMNMKDNVRNDLIQLLRDAESDRSGDQPHLPGNEHASLGLELFNLIHRLNEDAIKNLVELGADINVRNDRLETPLIKASSYRGDDGVTRSFLRIIKYLIKSGANVFAKDSENRTFLHVLMTHDPSVTPAQFHNMTLFLIKRNMSSLFMSPGGPSGNTALFGAVRFMTVEVATLTLLRENGVDFDVVNYNGDSVLLHAFKWKRNMKMLTDFVELGANWRYLNRRNQSLLHAAAEVGHVHGVKYFLDKGLDVNARDVVGWTPLHLIILNGRQHLLGVVRILIVGGADVTIMDNRGRTALSFARERNHIAGWDELIKLLVGSNNGTKIILTRNK